MCWPAGARPGSASVGVATSTQGGSAMNRPAFRSAPSWIMSSGQPARPADTAVRGPSPASNSGGAVVQ